MTLTQDSDHSDWETHIEWNWGTPLLLRRHVEADQLNKQLLESIDVYSSLPRVGRRLDGAERTHDFFESPNPARTRLSAWLREGIKILVEMDEDASSLEFELSGWILACEFGGSVPPHSHPNAIWSGVYYVDAGQDDIQDTAGEIELVDPRPAADYFMAPGRPFSSRFMLPPVAGSAVFFPGWLRHFVHPFWGKAPRISIPFNATPRAQDPD